MAFTQTCWAGGMAHGSCLDAPSPLFLLINKAFNITTAAYMHSRMRLLCLQWASRAWTRLYFPFPVPLSVLPVPPPSLFFPPSFPSHLTFLLFFQPAAPVGYLGSRCGAAVWPPWRAVNKNTLPLFTQSKLSLLSAFQLVFYSSTSVHIYL